MNRKQFITTTALTAIAVTACGTIGGLPINNLEGDCETTNDILGPFYRANTPIRQELTNNELEGNRIKLKGIVYGSDCKTPLKNVLVEIWHCDTEGNYDNTSEEYNQRGAWYTNEEGEYSFNTIIPGKYLNGSLYRPAHIHFRVTEKNSNELVSQIYFKHDPNIDKDPWASNPKASLRILPIIPEGTKGKLTINFDIFLTQKK